MNKIRWKIKSLLDTYLYPRNANRLLKYHLNNRATEPEEIWDQMARFSRIPPPAVWNKIPFVGSRIRGALWAFCGAMHHREEWCEFMQMVKNLKPRNSLEIGTADGGTLFGLAHYTSHNLLSIDLPGGIHGGGYTASRGKFYEDFELLNHGLKIWLYRGDSRDHSSRIFVDTALVNEPTEPLDMLFIDGSHVYSDVLADFKNYAPLVRNDGLIALHDIAAHIWELDCRVCNLWNQIVSAYPCCCSTILIPKEKMLGIGLVRMTTQLRAWAKNLQENK